MDSEVTFEDDADEEMDTTVMEEEDWIEYIKRSTEDAMDKMECAKIRCWNRTHKKMKWKLALRIATSLSERWLKKAAEWVRNLTLLTGDVKGTLLSFLFQVIVTRANATRLTVFFFDVHVPSSIGASVVPLLEHPSWPL